MEIQSNIVHIERSNLKVRGKQQTKTILVWNENDLHKRIPYNLQLFAKEGPGGEKTENATPKKLSNARKEGQVAKSQELITACSLLALFLMLKIYVGSLGSQFLELFQGTYATISTLTKEQITTGISASLINENIIHILVISLPIYLTAFCIAFLANKVQIKWMITKKPLKPKLSKINPFSGFKKIFSIHKVMELILSIAKIAIISVVVYTTIKDSIKILYFLYELDLTDAILLIGDIILDLGIKISAFFMIIGFIDYFYQKHKFKNDMKMTKQEVKDEYKNAEGDPKVKGKIRRRMAEASRRRMMQRLPEADVVITNPTHFACALLYDKEKSEAPILVAKGADYIAQKIKDAAKEHHVPIVENKPLARMLYYNVDLEQEIPQELYQMAAEVLAYVYSLKNKNA